MSIKLREDTTPATCQKCGASNVIFDGEYGYYKCKTCGDYWAFDKDDPDYQEHADICPSCGYDNDYPRVVETRECLRCGYEW
ncbi:hypothetical protein CAL7716_034870 [Calothrix sp. PCC 7716]|nr:hypothetical protein CAL7716_034870 [Calothrix sp. PCC 7716]